ncbi:hypothetical protein RFI_21751, partial [Reticulomyxa filosa]
QYVTKLCSEKIMKFVRYINGYEISKKNFKFRLASPEESLQVTGFDHNAVTPIGIKYSDIPIILSHRVLELGHFWMGGGEVDVKIAVNVNQFRNQFKPYIADITYEGFIDPTENLEQLTSTF